jgi:hypothetical protein
LAGASTDLTLRSPAPAEVSPLKALFIELGLLSGGAMALLALFRIRFALAFWRKIRLLAFVYVGVIIVMALIELIFHVRL